MDVICQICGEPWTKCWGIHLGSREATTPEVSTGQPAGDAR